MQNKCGVEQFAKFDDGPNLSFWNFMRTISFFFVFCLNHKINKSNDFLTGICISNSLCWLQSEIGLLNVNRYCNFDLELKSTFCFGLILVMSSI